MSDFLINSDTSLQTFLGDVREQFTKHRYIRADLKFGRDRTADQNALIHVWFAQIARELREDDSAGWKAYCKLHHGVPILRLDSDFRDLYDATFKLMSYEQKLLAIRLLPISSTMSKEQLSKYAESIQADFAKRGVVLEFPAEVAA